MSRPAENASCLGLVVRIGALFIALWLLGVVIAYSQPTTSTISPRAFGARSWRENGLAPLSLPLTGNSLWDVRLASDGQLYYWSGSAWVAITASGSGGGSSSAGDISILDAGSYYTGSTVESALQETGASLTGVSLDLSTIQTSIDTIVADPRWTDARTPLSHAHSAADTTSGTFADARISSSSVTQHESSLESVLDLQDLQGTVTDAQVPDTITISQTGTPSKCARFDGAGVLVAATGDCIDGATGSTGGGDVTGPATSEQYSLPRFSDTTGKVLEDSGVKVLSPSALTILPGDLTFGSASGGDSRIVSVPGSGGIKIMTGDNAYYQTTSTGNFRVFTYNGDMRMRLSADSNEVALASGVCLGFSSSSTAGSVDTQMCRGSLGVTRFQDAVSVTPRSTPPVICGDANTAGVIYFDSDSNSFCGCNGTAWSPGFGTSGPCS